MAVALGMLGVPLLVAQELSPSPPVVVEAPVAPVATSSLADNAKKAKVAPVGAQTLFAPLIFGDGVSTWTENAESGDGNVIDGTDVSYSLIQSDRVAEGFYAFHLAQPGFQDSWFVLDVAIDVLPETKLFFQSRLQYATSNQIAKVQVSFDGGATWPDTIYSQAGSGDSGEGAFALREVDLGSVYSGQQVKIRFLLDFTGSSAYTGTQPYVGWLIDDIQIGGSFQKTLWSIGNPTPYEVLYLEVVNRAREDAAVEANRLANLTDPQVTGAYQFFGIDPADIVAQFAWYVANGCMDQVGQPLAFNARLMETAQKHTQDMFTNAFQGHNSSANPVAPFQPGDTFGTRLGRVGYSGAAGENVYAYAKSVEHGHAGFDVDWGNTTNSASPCYNAAFVGQGMQNPAGHRTNLHRASYNEVGIGVINGTNGSVGPQIVTQDLGSSSGVSYITGVVYDDTDSDGEYTVASALIHEGRGGVRVDVEGSAFYALTADSGAYALPVVANGTYSVTFSGDGIESYTTSVTVLGGLNVKLDHDPVDLSGYALWASENGVLGGPLDDDEFDGIGNLVEYGVAGMSPSLADAYLLPALAPDSTDGRMRMVVGKRPGASDVEVTVRVSTNLADWFAAGELPGTMLEIDDAAQIVVSADQTLPSLFVKIQVTLLDE